MDKRDKNIIPISDYCLYKECVGRMFWDQLWSGPDAAPGLSFEQHWARVTDSYTVLPMLMLRQILFHCFK